MIYRLSFTANLTLEAEAVRKDVIAYKVLLLNSLMLVWCLLLTTDVVLLQAAGGDCIVDNSVTGLQRDIQCVVGIARDTGVKVVAGTGEMQMVFS